jgi:hypothetical protein
VGVSIDLKSAQLTPVVIHLDLTAQRQHLSLATLPQVIVKRMPDGRYGARLPGASHQFLNLAVINGQSSSHQKPLKNASVGV